MAILVAALLNLALGLTAAAGHLFDLGAATTLSSFLLIAAVFMFARMRPSNGTSHH